MTKQTGVSVNRALNSGQAGMRERRKSAIKVKYDLWRVLRCSEMRGTSVKAYYCYVERAVTKQMQCIRTEQGFTLY